VDWGMSFLTQLSLAAAKETKKLFNLKFLAFIINKGRKGESYQREKWYAWF